MVDANRKPSNTTFILLCLPEDLGAFISGKGVQLRLMQFTGRFSHLWFCSGPTSLPGSCFIPLNRVLLTSELLRKKLSLCCRAAILQSAFIWRTNRHKGPHVNVDEVGWGWSTCRYVYTCSSKQSCLDLKRCEGSSGPRWIQKRGYSCDVRLFLRQKDSNAS